jgi:hypothetical protein
LRCIDPRDYVIDWQASRLGLFGLAATDTTPPSATTGRCGYYDLVVHVIISSSSIELAEAPTNDADRQPN